MNKHNNDTAKALSEARRKNAAAALTARYAELDRQTGMAVVERIKELTTNKNDRE
ncbi:hypothetical protein GCM10027422_09220 [Hymenobacter arcticus]